MLSAPRLSSQFRTTPLSCDLDWYYQLQKRVDAQQQSIERWHSFTRNLKEKPFGDSHKYDFLVEFFVDEITGPYDQDISLLMVGNKGRGKSIAAQSICYFSACELAERLGGKWQDYYDPFRNMAVILEDEANALMAIQERYQVKNYDDIGIGWGARNWQDKENKDKNDVFQINRTDATIQVFSVPNQFLLDKVPRSLVSHYAEMDQQFFAHGFTTLKLFHPQTLFREGKIIQPYIRTDRTKYVLFRIPRPPSDLVEFYKKKRRENKEKATNRRMNDDCGQDEVAKPATKNAKVSAMEERIMSYAHIIKPIIFAGGSKKDVVEALHDEGIDRTKGRRWTSAPEFDKLFPPSA